MLADIEVLAGEIEVSLILIVALFVDDACFGLLGILVHVVGLVLLLFDHREGAFEGLSIGADAGQLAV